MPATAISRAEPVDTMAAWLLLLWLVAPTDEAIVWGEGNARQVQRALDDWFRAQEWLVEPVLELRPGFPVSMADPSPDAAPGVEWAVLGICGPAQAQEVIAALRAVKLVAQGRRLAHGEVPPLLEGRSRRAAPRPDRCPRIVRRPATTVADLVGQMEAKKAKAAERRRARVALCSFGSEERRERYGTDNVCLGLWGLTCADYAALAARVEIKAENPCPFLLGDAAAAQAITIRLDRSVLTFCDAERAAFVFARSRQGRLQYPVAIICGHGPGFATRLLRTAGVGAGVCVEYVRLFDGSGAPTQMRTNPTTRTGVNAGLLCYAQTVKPPHAVVETLPLVDGRGAGRYGIVNWSGERVLCSDQTAFRLTKGGLLRIEPRPRACVGATTSRVALEP